MVSVPIEGVGGVGPGGDVVEDEKARRGEGVEKL